MRPPEQRPPTQEELELHHRQNIITTAHGILLALTKSRGTIREDEAGELSAFAFALSNKFHARALQIMNEPLKSESKLHTL